MQTIPTMVQPAQRMAFLGRLLALVFLAVFSTFLYTFVHEAGHALIGMAFGGRLSSFSVRFWDLSAHAGIHGDFSVAQRSLISLAGILTPLVLWLLFLALTPKKSSTLLLWFKIFGSMGVVNTLIAWIVIPFLYMSNRAPSDDSTTFLNLTGIPPILVAAVALAVYAYGWALLLNRIGGLHGLRGRLALDKHNLLDPAGLRTLVKLVLVFASVALLSLAINQWYPFADALAAPEGYTAIFTLDLSARGYDSAAVYTFTLDAPQEIGLHFAIQNVQRGPVHITLNGSNGYQNTFLRGDGAFSAGQATVNPPEIPLEQGQYSVEITFPQGQGKLSGAIRLEQAAE